MRNELNPGIVDELLKDAKDALLELNASKNLGITDDLGFYLSSPDGKRSHNGVESNCFIDLAGQFKRVSDELTEKQRKMSDFENFDTSDYGGDFRKMSLDQVKAKCVRKSPGIFPVTINPAIHMGYQYVRYSDTQSND
uniref:Uncharacterized protein n=1 Tax=Romanomermis culicivorax TaxID=13658 RepID=A0A915ICX6_ROMCU